MADMVRVWTFPGFIFLTVGNYALYVQWKVVTYFCVLIDYSIGLF